MSPASDERRRIREAMSRILNGTAEQSNGALTIVALAAEAGVPRNALTQRHPDLKNEFYAQVSARGEITDAEKRLRKKIVKLKELRAADQNELAQLRDDVEILARVVNQLTLENRQLRLQVAAPESALRSLPSQPRPPAGRSWPVG
ncbi:hypothetical protein GQF42_16200 [Streptomyces broussonetiae]|uniref:Uncharacterized protein n=1 Tax=Streptomyces broussonetiae TaxID=2686304 RepID=A0A6I6N1Y7_9ACTN|nr:hypothetical protein [Streptomyces broussonetiae]QHA04629.1 hypothetical protein GQF42_16200 [Streptomyces broussonetiae]